ncbi:MAG: hypothetical protein PHR28_09235 [candidate division Zixibacteria bacterium]|jgi:hypothetical protein|nr:hypothetical protein [candidate division Zixibacteria bacterium]
MTKDVTEFLNGAAKLLALNVEVKTYSLPEYCDRYKTELTTVPNVDIGRSFVVTGIDANAVDVWVKQVTELLAYRIPTTLSVVWHEISLIHGVETYSLAFVAKGNHNGFPISDMLRDPTPLIEKGYVEGLATFIEDACATLEDEEMITADIRLSVEVKYEGYVTLRNVEIPRRLGDDENVDELLDYLNENVKENIENAVAEAANTGELSMDEYSLTYEVEEVDET